MLQGQQNVSVIHTQKGGTASKIGRHDEIVSCLNSVNSRMGMIARITLLCSHALDSTSQSGYRV